MYHVSENPHITIFHPRESANSGKVVWAVDETHLCNYLLPRDCPRVTFGKGSNTSEADRKIFLGDTENRQIYVEERWMETIRATVLYVYKFPKAMFVPLDIGAGYYISKESITPLSVTAISDVITAIAARKADLHTLPDLWELSDSIAKTTLEFSSIRMRNATPRKGVAKNKPTKHLKPNYEL